MASNSHFAGRGYVRRALPAAWEKHQRDKVNRAVWPFVAAATCFDDKAAFPNLRTATGT
jgi:hypothetical protein